MHQSAKSFPPPPPLAVIGFHRFFFPAPNLGQRGRLLPLIHKLPRLPRIRPRASGPRAGGEPGPGRRGCRRARRHDVPLHAPVAQLRRVPVQVQDGGRRRRALAREPIGGGAASRVRRRRRGGHVQEVAPRQARGVDGAAEVGLRVAAHAAAAVRGEQPAGRGGGGRGGRGRGAGAGAVGGGRRDGRQRRSGHLS